MKCDCGGDYEIKGSGRGVELLKCNKCERTDFIEVVNVKVPIIPLSEQVSLEKQMLEKSKKVKKNGKD